MRSPIRITLDDENLFSVKETHESNRDKITGEFHLDQNQSKNDSISDIFLQKLNDKFFIKGINKLECFKDVLERNNTPGDANETFEDVIYPGIN